MIKVIEEKHNELLPKKKPLPRKKHYYVYTCRHCGSKLLLEREDIMIREYCGNVYKEYFCPVCNVSNNADGMIFHRISKTIYNKKYKTLNQNRHEI